MWDWGNLKALAFIIAVVLFLPTWGCNYGRMNEQEAIKTYEEAVPAMPEGTIPAAGGVEILRNANPDELKNPLPFTPLAVEQGKTAYGYFCLQCHGPHADGHGTVGQSFSPLPANLADPQVQAQSDGEIFVKILLGFKRHPPLTTTVSEEDAWAVVNYLRSLKKKS
jgi:mono/diheme cytochrome c family protein